MLPETREEAAFAAGMSLGAMVATSAIHAYLSMAMIDHPEASLRVYLWIIIVPAFAATVVYGRIWSQTDPQPPGGDSA